MIRDFRTCIGNARHMAHDEVIQWRMAQLIELYRILQVDMPCGIHRITVDPNILKSGYQLIIDTLVSCI